MKNSSTNFSQRMCGLSDSLEPIARRFGCTSAEQMLEVVTAQPHLVAGMMGIPISQAESSIQTWARALGGIIPGSKALKRWSPTQFGALTARRER